MEDKKKYCGNLYEEYKRLKEKTNLIAQKMTIGQKISPQHIDPKDLLRREEIRIELIKNCKDFLDSLKPAEKFELENE